jgi:hypothetical protein
LTDGNAEPPETPAHVFAGRALKSALFGTPAPPDATPFVRAIEKTSESVADQQKAQSRDLSPVKLPGILMTPGTATIRRKSVSFGHDVKDKDAEAGREGRRPGRNRPTRSASLTRALEIAKEEKDSKVVESVNVVQSTTTAMKTGTLDSQPSAFWRKESDYLTRPSLIEELARDDPDGDMTMDLNKPHSQSGRYWKSEFHKYHEEAQIQMRRLLQYKEGAKDFARKKDAEVLELKQRLKEAGHRKALSDIKVSRTLRRKARALGYDSDEGLDVSQLIEDLSRKTALCEQYKKQLEAATFTLEKKNPLSQDLLTMTTGKDSPPHMELLREEILHLQNTLKKTERENTRLENENKQLKEEVSHSGLKLERQIEKLDKQRDSFDDVRRKKDEALDQLQNTYDRLKENAKLQRRDAEQLLKKRHEQSVELKKELAEARQLETRVKELENQLQRKNDEHIQVVADYELRMAELKRDVVAGETAFDDLHLARSFVKLTESPIRARDSQIPLASNSVSRPVKATNRHTWSDTPTSSPPKKTTLPLSEIINKANPSTIPPVQSGPVQFTPAVHRFSDLSMPNPEFDLPSSEPSIELALPTLKQRISPRPAFVHIPSSPPKPSRISLQDNKDKIDTRERQTSSGPSRSTVDSSRIRREVAPERAAAAKARLEQKMAEKRKAQAAATGKENVAFL